MTSTCTCGAVVAPSRRAVLLLFLLPLLSHSFRAFGPAVPTLLHLILELDALSSPCYINGMLERACLCCVRTVVVADPSLLSSFQ